MALSKERLLHFMQDKLGIDTADVDEETRLFSSGIIDSAGLVELIVFVESEENMKFAPEDISLDHLDSIAQVLGFVAEKRAL
ncbi:MAG TPA: acyl carrier protein [Candidatus Margulisiibacteriota bacterium]|nr:acyl carrier protein [Candidatus Margulisiibacteriota bacterium]